MRPAEPQTSPRRWRPVSLADRIVIALRQLRIAREAGDVSQEWVWQSMMDRMLDRYAQGWP